MGIALPQVITSDRASGALVVDGSLNFNQISEPCLTRSLGSSGNRSTWTVSLWAKLTPNTTTYNPFFMGTSDNMQWEYEALVYANSNLYYIDYTSQAAGSNIELRTNDNFRDSGGWYHIVVQKVSNAGGIKLYVNNRLLDSFSSNTNNGRQSSHWNTTGSTQSIGNDPGGQSTPNSQMSQFYFIDGQALGPENFGRTDGLTGTWRPKKYTGTFGTNGFYLPMDGNSPIGEDKSGLGNNWTPKGFGGSNSLDKATGAKPILNTLPGGTTATPGVFGSKAGAQYTTTSASNSGGKYYFSHDATAQPTFSFIRGATYTFDWSASSGHPLRFATAADAAGSTEYTDGTDVTGNVTTITVPHNAPDTLYYYCNVHNGMGNSISVTTDETKADPYAWKCVLALPLVDDVEDISDHINATTTKKAATNYGSTDSSIISNFYGSSRKFDGSNDNINYAASADLGFDGDFTIECFSTPSPGGTNGVISSKAYYNSNNNWYLNFTTNGGGELVWYSYTGTGNGENINATSNGATDTNKMYHIAVSRVGSTVRLFLDGIHIGSTLNSSRDYNDGVTNGLTVGRIPRDNSANTAYGWHNGYIQDLRIYKGVGKYTSNFVVPSTNPDILPDTPSGVSGGSKLAKITEGAVSFDGAGDYLLVEHSDMAMGTGDFTVEFSVYNKTNKNYNAFISTRETGNGTTAGFVIASDAAGDLYVHSNGAMAGNYSGDLILPLNQWCHVAYTRSGGTHRLFLNGVAAANSTTTSRDYTEDMLVIGDNGYAKDEPIDGFISNVRVIKGTALYTSNFTPPTRELTNVTNTKLLCCQSNTLAGSAAVSPNISGTINTGIVWSHQNSFNIAVAGTTETGSLAAVFNPTTGVTGAADSFGFLNGAFDYTYTPNTPISYSDKVRVWTGFGGNVYLNDGSAVSTTSNNWTTLATGSNGTVDSIRFTASGSGGWWSGLEIDDVMLVDPVNTNGDAAATTFNPFNTDINTVRGQETGYCTFNVLRERTGGYNPTFKDGNLFMDGRGDGTGTLSASSGKFYYEVFIDTVTTTTQIYIGVLDAAYSGVERSWSTTQAALIRDSGSFYGNGSTGTAVSYGAGDLLSFAFDVDNNKLYIAKNGVYMNGGVPSQGTGFTHSGISFAGGYTPMVSDGQTGQKFRANFGQKPFKFPPPAGFQPLNAANVRPETVISRSDQFVEATIWTGDGVNGRTIPTTSKPDFVWLKSRAVAGRSYYLYDSVRGFGANKELVSNSTVEEGSDNHLTQNHGYVSGTTATGFTLASGATNSTYTNDSGVTYVGWSWKAGGNKNTFNIDDVGYANASDVNMSVDSLTNSVYNQSDTWSNYWDSNTYSTTAPHDSNLTNNTNSTAYGANTGCTWTHTIPFTTSVKLWVYTTANEEVKVNGTSVIGQNVGTSTNSPKIVDVTSQVTSPVTSIFFSRYTSGGSAYCFGIEIDGKLLVDSGVSVANVPSYANTGASVGTKQGFSIVKWTHSNGTAGTISHGLSKAPTFVIYKSIDNVKRWTVGHKEVPWTQALVLNDNGAALAADGAYWSNTPPTSSVFTIGDTGQIGNGAAIAYCWHDVPGLQKFGKYIGNDDVDGPYIELGFRPAIIIIKRSDGSTNNWILYDSSRNTANVMGKQLYPNDSAAEADATQDAHARLDFLSNGVKLRGSHGSFNADGGTFIYMAWAEAPTFNLFGAQSNAR